jgi:hypothetical protein
MIGGVGQRMLTGVSKRMADEFFRNVDAVLSGAAPVAAGAAGFPAEPGAPKPSGPASPGLPPGPSTVAHGTAVHPAAPAAAGTVFTAPAAAAPSGSQPGFVVGVLVGAGAALVGAVVGGWIASRRRG